MFPAQWRHLRTINSIPVRSIFRFACRSIRRSLLRSSLTAFSLVIGVAAVIAMVGIGSGAKARVQESIAALDLNRLSMNARLQKGEGAWQTSFPNGDGVTIADYHAIRQEIPGFPAVSPYLEPSGLSRAPSARGRVSNARVIGMDVDGFKLESRTLVRGAFFSSGDVTRASSVCVITESVVQSLFPGSDPIGGMVQIQDAPFRIIGVVKDRMAVSETADLHRGSAQIIVPYTSLLQRVDRGAGDSMIIWMRARSAEQLPILKQQVSNLMERRRGKRKVEFPVQTTADLAVTYTTSSNTLALLLALISGISLLVGGVGIMNVMLMSVKERTREIGIRVAIGARESDVLGQMLLEAVILSVLGGVVGIALGVGSAGVVSQWNDWPLLITPTAVLGAFLLSVFVGLFFGYYPARRAAQLNPIDALRAD